MPELFAHGLTGPHRPARFDAVRTAEPRVPEAVARHICQMQAVELLDDVFELVRDPLARPRPWTDEDGDDDQAGHISADRGTGFQTRLDERGIHVNPDNRSCLRDALVLQPKGRRQSAPSFSASNELNADNDVDFEDGAATGLSLMA